MTVQDTGRAVLWEYAMSTTQRVLKVQKRLRRQYEKTGSYGKLAKHFGVTKGVLYNFVVVGIVPADQETRIKLGIEKRNESASRLLATQARQQKLNMIARDLGYENWSNYGTRMIEKWENHEKV